MKLGKWFIVGRITDRILDTGGSLKHAFLRGGNWNNGANAGAFTLNLNNASTDTNTNIGFRCARYSLKSLGLNKVFMEISLRQEDYGFNPFPKAPLENLRFLTG